MLENLGTIRFIGDLSLQDADVLAKHGRRSKAILEFGAGGSTQILAQCLPRTLISVETDPEWVSITRSRLEQIDSKTPAVFCDYKEARALVADTIFDLILVDGVEQFRKDFGIQTWRLLASGGVMLFHDTRRDQDLKNALEVAQRYFNEIRLIEVNAPGSDGESSNMTVIHKKVHEPYVDWNYSENKPLWAYGGQPDTEKMPLWKQGD